MSEQEPGKKQSNRPPSGPVSSPRAYFGRASRAATGALRAGISDSAEAPPAAAPRRPTSYRAGDPALRLFAGFALPLAPTTPLTGAVATLSGIRDGEHERLFIDLGTSLVRAAPQRDESAGTLRLVLSRTQSAETYGTLLASLRYVNDAPAPAPGARRIALEVVDASGRARNAAEAVFSVGEEPREAAPAAVSVPSEAPNAAALAALAPGTGPTPADEPALDERIVLGESFAFNADGDYTVFWWPSRLPAPAERMRRAPQGPAPDAGSFFSAGGRLYRVFESPAEPPLPAAPKLPDVPLAVLPGVPAPAPAPLAAAAVLSAQTPVAANDSAPAPQRAANDSVWVPGRGVPPPGFARAPMLRLEDIFGSDMQDAIARRLIDMRIASGGG